jgi:hypothetical protein
MKKKLINIENLRKIMIRYPEPKVQMGDIRMKEVPRDQSKLLLDPEDRGE